MKVSIPKQSVYYYECSNGWFRLFYFIPPGTLERLCKEKRISKDVLNDFPDGVDLGCTEGDFKQFEDEYGYKLPFDPSELRSAFFAIFSTTRKWKKFCGTGFIPAQELERYVKKVTETLTREEVSLQKAQLRAPQMPLPELRQQRQMAATQSKQAYDVLQKLQLRGIDAKRTLSQQEFSAIDMEDGHAAEDVFIQLHQRQITGE